MFKKVEKPPRTYRSRTAILVLTALVLQGITPQRVEAKNPKSAKDLVLKGFGGALSSAGSWGAEFLLNAMAGALYTQHCGKDQVNDAAGELLCMVAGETSGKAEEAWREEVGQKLEALQGQLDDVLAGQVEIENAISRQSDALRQAIESLPTQVAVHADLVRIQAAWSAFHEYFQAVEPKDPETTLQSMRKLAKDLLTNPAYNVEASARSLRVAIVEGAAGNPPVPMLLARQIDAWPRAGRKPEAWDGNDPDSFDVRPQYVQLELAMRQWLLRQKQAQVLFLWSARALEGTPDAPRLTAREYGKEYSRNLEIQLEAFQRAVEWLVLANSFPRSPFADFLPSGAEEVFERADALQALALSTPDDVAEQSAGQAIWGRVIAMGSGPGSTLTLAAPGNRPLGLQASSTSRVAVKGWPELDWWTASDPSQPLVFDRIDFSNEWTVYRFKQPLGNEARLGSYRFDPHGPGNALPYLPPTVEVDNSLSEITGRASERFGSFVGIARAGGAYALFSGEYDQERKESWGEAAKLTSRVLRPTPTASDLDTTIDQRKRIERVDRSRGTLPRPIVGEEVATRRVVLSGTAYIDGSRDLKFSVERRRSFVLRSQKTIRPRSGQSLELEMNAIWSGEPLGSPIERPSEQVLVSTVHNSTPTRFLSALKISLGSHMVSPRNGVSVWMRPAGSSPEGDHQSRTQGQHDVATAFLPATGYRLEIAAVLELDLPRNPRPRTWTWLARGSWQTAYLTR